ncbi:hypothetical protein AX15_000484 [Amanita polypyramis BW_CC]|nr:hypothetical protein AX15_000484 [Amanita polypyramis BW_CC]
MPTSTSSPVRAIRSPLVARPSNSIPPQHQTYLPLARRTLQQRLLRHIFFYTALACWIQATLWALWTPSAGGADKPLGSSNGGAATTLVAPFYFSTVLLAAVMWFVAALPAVVVRKTYLTTKPTLATCPSVLLKSALVKPCTSRSILTYLLSSLAILALHVLFDGDSKLRVFVKSKKHPFYLNPRLIYLAFSQVVVALVYTLRNVLLDRFVFRFPVPSLTSRPITPLTVIHTLFISTILATLSAPLTCLLFVISRLLLPLLYLIPPLPYLLRPFTAHFLRGSWSLSLPLYHLSLLIRGWFITYTTLLIWEFASVLFELSISQPITVSHLTADPILALVSGISISPLKQEDSFPFHYFAYQELRNTASSQAPQATSLRSALFSDQKYTPTLWSQLVRESLLLLGHDFQKLVRRGQPPPAVPAPAGAVPTDAEKQQPANGALPFPSTPVKFVSASSSAFKPPGIDGQRLWTSPGQSAAECLASDGPLARAVEEGAGEMEEVVGKVPELFRSVLRERRGGRQSGIGVHQENGGGGEGNVVTKSAGTVVGLSSVWNAVEETKKRVINRVNAWVEWDRCPVWIKKAVKTVYDWWTRERLYKRVENGIPNREVDLVVFDMLSHLVSASLTEDQYGVVQRDTPKILEAMVRFLGEVEKWRKEIPAASSVTASEPSTSGANLPTTTTTTTTTRTTQADEERAHANAILTEMSDGLKESIGRIVRTFGDKLGAFRFPPSVARGLQPFLDYC